MCEVIFHREVLISSFNPDAHLLKHLKPEEIDTRLLLRESFSVLNLISEILSEVSGFTPGTILENLLQMEIKTKVIKGFYRQNVLFHR